MKNYIGTKKVKAEKMSRLAYCELRGWELPANENPNDIVYLVEYAAEENNPSNHKDYKGYITMSPESVFEKSYKIADDYKDRLLIEYCDLNEKVIALTSALDNNEVPNSLIKILSIQLDQMKAYRDTLVKRM